MKTSFYFELRLTLKKAFVEPQQYVPYLIFVCLERSSAELTGEDILELVRKAKKQHVLYKFKADNNLNGYQPSLRCRRTS